MAIRQEEDVELDGLFDRLVSLSEDTGQDVVSPASSQAPAEVARIRAPERYEELAAAKTQAIQESSPPRAAARERFFPLAPRSLAEVNISESMVEMIILRLLTIQESMKGADIAQRIGIPFPVAQKVMQGLKSQRLLMHKSAGTLTDFIYEITEAGAAKVRQNSQCTYCGTVPVSLQEYEVSVAAQSLSKLEPQVEDLKRAFRDLTLSDDMLRRLGLAIVSGKGLFLHGRPGNGKTAVAERITSVYGTTIWIPRAISVWGEVIRLYDPGCHEELPLAQGDKIVDDEQIDHRWVRIRRPTIVVGGELTLQNLDITTDMETRVAEAPVQMKSNCGTLVIDDFGRQRIAPSELLNRWIVPLEKRFDILNLASGRKFRVPFDQFTVFSTNLEPKDLVDEAFLRRIPFKIEIENPNVEQFRLLFRQTCAKLRLGYNEAALDYLLVHHYEQARRELRFCHPRDLLHQVSIFCRFLGRPPEASIEALETAAKNYFATMGQ